MRRRTFLELIAGAAVAASPRLHALGDPNVVIAGGGILGAQIAYRLARRGAAVTLVERERPAAGATAKSFAWINSTYAKQPWAYYYLNRLGIEAWRALDAELPGALPVTWGGSVEWYGDEARVAPFRRSVEAHERWGYPTRLIDEARLGRARAEHPTGPRRRRGVRRRRGAGRSGGRGERPGRAREGGGRDDSISGRGDGHRHARRPAARRAYDGR